MWGTPSSEDELDLARTCGGAKTSRDSAVHLRRTKTAFAWNCGQVGQTNLWKVQRTNNVRDLKCSSISDTWACFVPVHVNISDCVAFFDPKSSIVLSVGGEPRCKMCQFYITQHVTRNIRYPPCILLFFFNHRALCLFGMQVKMLEKIMCSSLPQLFLVLLNLLLRPLVHFQIKFLILRVDIILGMALNKSSKNTTSINFTWMSYQEMEG